MTVAPVLLFLEHAPNPFARSHPAGRFPVARLPRLRSADGCGQALRINERSPGSLAAAAPFYDYSSPTLKPFHLKATYQLYENGQPAEQGTFEYWFASPQLYRRSWTRAGVAQTYWHLADGKYVSAVSGRLNFFERKLPEALFSPLPTAAELDPSKVRLDAEKLPTKVARIPCFMVVPQMHIFGSTQNVPLGLFPTYCFDPDSPGAPGQLLVRHRRDAFQQGGHHAGPLHCPLDPPF
jgi:hypothetical protein